MICTILKLKRQQGRHQRHCMLIVSCIALEACGLLVVQSGSGLVVVVQSGSPAVRLCACCSSTQTRVLNNLGNSICHFEFCSKGHFPVDFHFTMSLLAFSFPQLCAGVRIFPHHRQAPQPASTAHRSLVKPLVDPRASVRRP